ncbi:MAG: hypothetical protein KGH49_00110 [Candidatus Micrarchaeota archaeon]|nr:hypothetical protein [Candidatus Micrarchaeota archaeon]
MAQRHKSASTAFAVGLLILIILVVGVAFILVYYLPNQAVMHPPVQLTGAVKTLGLGTTPLNIAFRTYNNQYYTTVTNNQYAIVLPSDRIYNVTVYWSSVGSIVSGSCPAGSINLYSAGTTAVYNASC